MNRFWVAFPADSGRLTRDGNRDLSLKPEHFADGVITLKYSMDGAIYQGMKALGIEPMTRETRWQVARVDIPDYRMGQYFRRQTMTDIWDKSGVLIYEPCLDIPSCYWVCCVVTPPMPQSLNSL